MTTDISERITSKLNEIVKDPHERKMIVDLLGLEKRYTIKDKTDVIKREFQLLIDQHFPLTSDNNE